MSSYNSIPTSHTPIVDSVESNSDHEVVEMKVKMISAWKAAVIFACAGCLAYAVVVRSGGTFTTTRMRGGGTTTTTVLATAVTGTTEELGCVGHYHLCSGVGRGNCCEGFECDGPIAFGTCNPFNCGNKGSMCTGFGTSNSCCKGLTCEEVFLGPIPFPPGTGMCDAWKSDDS